MFAKNENGTIKYISVVLKDAADTPRNPYATGYGSKIPSSQLALVNGKWQRVYVAQYSNAGSPWVQIKGERVCIRERDVENGSELYLTNMDFFKFVMGYMECLKWSTSGEFKGVDYDSLENFQMSREAWNQTLESCFDFWFANMADIKEAAQRYHDISGTNGYAAAGHDCAFRRNDRTHRRSRTEVRIRHKRQMWTDKRHLGRTQRLLASVLVEYRCPVPQPLGDLLHQISPT